MCAVRRKVGLVCFLIGKKCRYREKFMEKQYLKMKEIELLRKLRDAQKIVMREMLIYYL
jgi:hypothetical protein